MKTYWVNEGGRYEHGDEIHSSEFMKLNCSDSAVSAQLSVLAETDEDISSAFKSSPRKVPSSAAIVPESAPILLPIDDVESPIREEKHTECSAVDLPSSPPDGESAPIVSSFKPAKETIGEVSPVDDYERKRRLGAQMRAEKLRKVFEKMEAMKQQTLME